MRDLEGVGVDEQLLALEARALDARPALTTPFPSLNEQLYRGGNHPGELIVLGGRKGTRKTCVMLSWVWHLLEQEVPVGVLTLDEGLPMYVAKLVSVMSKLPSEYIEENWNSEPVERLREEYADRASLLTLSKGVRPNIRSLQSWLEVADVEGRRPRVVFVDYVNLLVAFRAHPTERIPQLFDELQTWAMENELVVVALHQAGRSDEGVSKKYHGDTPMTAEGLLYGGEQQADIILATYRLCKNYLGNMSRRTAEAVMGDSFDEEKWANAVGMVKATWNETNLQLLKNRPSTHDENYEGYVLVSPNESQFIEEKGEAVTDTAQWKLEAVK